MQEMMEMYRDLGISPQVLAFGNQIEAELKERFQEIDENAEYNQLKAVSYTHLFLNRTTLSGTFR